MDRKLIYCQRNIPRKELRYGLHSSASTGCGWIAVYNILTLYGKQPKPKEIIYEMEHDLPYLNGLCGSFLMSPAWVLRRHGFQVCFTTKRNKIDQIAAENETGILFYCWKSKHKIGAHFVAVEKTDMGYIGYNTYSNSKGPDKLGTSIETFLDQRKYFGAVYFGITEDKSIL